MAGKDWEAYSVCLKTVINDVPEARGETLSHLPELLVPDLLRRQDPLALELADLLFALARKWPDLVFWAVVDRAEVLLSLLQWVPQDRGRKVAVGLALLAPMLPASVLERGLAQLLAMEHSLNRLLAIRGIVQGQINDPKLIHSTVTDLATLLNKLSTSPSPGNP